MNEDIKIGDYVKIIKETEWGTFTIGKKYKVINNDYSSIQSLQLEDNDKRFIWVNDDEWKKLSNYEDLKKGLLKDE